MYTIRWVSEQLGLAPGTLRAWEQRYGIVRPERTDGGFRLYSEEDVARLRSMTTLIADGMQAAQAAELVLAQANGAPSVASAHAGYTGLPDTNALALASQTYDVRALEAALDVVFAATAFEAAVDDWLFGALRHVGDQWQSGALDVAQEHFVSAGVMRRLAAAFDAAGGVRIGPRVVTGLAPGATHEIAALAFATMLRRAGVQATYLGADLPAASWVEAIQTIRPAAVVIGAPMVGDQRAADCVVAALLAHDPQLRIFVGGHGAAPDRALVGDTLSSTSAWLADALAKS